MGADNLKVMVQGGRFKAERRAQRLRAIEQASQQEPGDDERPGLRRERTCRTLTATASATASVPGTSGPRSIRVGIEVPA
jgi:hypothetical protein